MYHFDSGKTTTNKNYNNNDVDDTSLYTNSKNKSIIYWPTVYNYNDETDSIEESSWNKCILNKLGIDHEHQGNMGKAKLKLDMEAGRLIISSDNEKEEEKKENDKYIMVTLAHAPQCPFDELEKSNSLIHKDLQIDKKQFPPFKVGVSVLIEDQNQRVLITKRSDRLRLFPGIHVLAGGHTEANESFYETGKREVLEETGINLESESLSIIGAFESGFPHFLSDDRLPSDHHLVIYLYVKLSKPINQYKVTLDSKEVSFASWIPKTFLKSFLSTLLPDDYIITSKTTPPIEDDRSKDIELIYPFDSKEIRLTSRQLKSLFIQSKEILSLGTVYILKQYINM